MVDGELLVAPFVLPQELVGTRVRGHIIGNDIGVVVGWLRLQLQHPIEQRVVFLVGFVLAHCIGHVLLVVYLLLILERLCLGRHGTNPLIVERVFDRLVRCSLCIYL